MFTDQQLADQMWKLLIQHDVMSGAQFLSLQNNSTEVNVQNVLGNPPALAPFVNYWNALGVWINNNGGQFMTMTGLNVQGRTGGNPAGLAARAIYNDAFRDTRQWIGNPGFRVAKAISNHCRFISLYK